VGYWIERDRLSEVPVYSMYYVIYKFRHPMVNRREVGYVINKDRLSELPMHSVLCHICILTS